jgi:hypothetical protein
MSQHFSGNSWIHDEDVQTDDLVVVGEEDDVVVVDVDVDILVVDVRVVYVVMELTSSNHLTLDDFQFDSEHSGSRMRNIFVCSIHNISKFDSDKSTSYEATFGLEIVAFGLGIEINGLFVDTLDIEIFGLLVETFGLFAEALGHEIALFVATSGILSVTFGLSDQ